MFLEELFKLRPQGNRKSICSWFFAEDFFWLFQSMTTYEEQKSLENLVLVAEKLVYE